MHSDVWEACWNFFKWLAVVVLVLVALAAFTCGYAAREAQAADALHEVNAARQRRGLRPFVFDNNLARAAEACCKYRAWQHVEGHVGTGRDRDWRRPKRSDFDYDPSRTARAAGCGAMEPHWGWETCCTYDRWSYARAWVEIGSDGLRYMHIFVR